MDKKNKNPSKNSPFTNSDYNSGDGMMTSVWGPATWAMLHCLVLKIKDDANNINQLKILMILHWLIMVLGLAF